MIIFFIFSGNNIFQKDINITKYSCSICNYGSNISSNFKRHKKSMKHKNAKKIKKKIYKKIKNYKKIL